MLGFDPDDPDDAGSRPDRGALESKRILGELRTLRHMIVDAWHERHVILTKEEQRELQAEIKETCDLLTELTSNP